jgi:hypothetical protein
MSHLIEFLLSGNLDLEDDALTMEQKGRVSFNMRYVKSAFEIEEKTCINL